MRNFRTLRGLDRPRGDVGHPERRRGGDRGDRNDGEGARRAGGRSALLRRLAGASGALALLAGLAFGPSPLSAQEPAPAGKPQVVEVPVYGGAPDPSDPLAFLRQEIAEMKRAYEAKIQALESRIEQLEAGRGVPPGTPVPAPEGDDLAALRAAAAAEAAAAAGAPPGSPSPPVEASEDSELAEIRAAAAETTGAPAPGTAVAAGPVSPSGEAGAPSFGSERNLNRLNPEISMTGDLVGIATDRGREDFSGREFELNVQSALDPYSFTKWTLSFNPEEGVDIEEGYVAYTGLPGGLTLTAGKFRQSFGALNRWHLHALPQIDYPLALRKYFGDEGLAQTGVSASWLLPHPWASANELDLQVTDGKNEAFGGESFQHLVGLAHLKNYWDVNDSTYAELGLSGIAGTNGTGGESQVYGADFTLHWQPPQRAKYREVTWRTELLRSRRDDAEQVRHDAWGGYSYFEGLVAQNLYGGLRYDRVEDPLDPGHTTWGLFPNLTWWQSEFVRLRGEYGYLRDARTGERENRFTLQLTWAAGPHKHETY